MDVKNVSASKPNPTGAVYIAPLTATVPTSLSAALTDFTALGYCSDAGLTNSNSPSYTDVKAWGGDIVLSSQTEKTDTFTFTLIECLDENVLKAVYGDANVTKATSEIHVQAKGTELTNKAFVIDMIMSNGKAKRIVVPNAKVTNVGTINYNDSDVVGYELTITAYPVSGVTHHEYIAV